MRKPLFKVDLGGLNPRQREAVSTVDGPLLVLAGAGTGKTRVVTSRIAWLIAGGIEPEAILAVTFTNKAALEMKERIGRMVPRELAQKVTACTFHSFGARLLRQHIGRLDYSPRFDIASDSYTDGVVRELLAELALNRDGQLPAAAWKSLISRAKSSLLAVGDVVESSDGGSWPLGFRELYRRYRGRMQSLNMLDFDDLLGLTVELWRRCPEILGACRERYRYLLVDEYQDTNHAQFALTSMLAGPRANLCVVGDDDQSIYGWRGAAVGHILEFKDHFPKAAVIRLEQNYRSTNTILEAANHVIANNAARHDKALWSQAGAGEKILVVKAADERDEARCLAELIRDRRATRAGSLADFAVLYRSNHLSRAVEEALRHARIDYCLVGGKSFYQRREILDAISMLRLVRNPRDDQSLLRVLNVPPRGIGEKSVERLRELQRIVGRPLSELLGIPEYQRELTAGAAQAVREFDGCLLHYRERFARGGGLADTVRAFLTDSGYLSGLARMYKPRADALKRRDNLLEFVNSAAEFEDRAAGRGGLEEFLESFALRDDSDRVQGRPDNSVNLMTVHAAKGLEFPVVMVIGLEQDLFPHYNSVREGGLDEERRLFYVAATRAREELILTYTSSRRINGAPSPRQISRFIREIPLRYTVEADSGNALRPAPAAEAADYLKNLKDQFAV